MAKLDLVDVFKKRTRHPFRPRASDIIDRLFPDFKPIENTGCSLILGSCSFLNKDLLVIGQQKPKPSDFKNRDDLNILNYGMLTSDDHSRILTNLKQAKESDPSVGGAIASYAALGGM
jgi:acetyl-CoA carboxylase alpha subunit